MSDKAECKCPLCGMEPQQSYQKDMDTWDCGTIVAEGKSFQGPRCRVRCIEQQLKLAKEVLEWYGNQPERHRGCLARDVLAKIGGMDKEDGDKRKEAIKTPIQIARKYLQLPWITRMDIAETLDLIEEGDGDLLSHELDAAIFRRARERGQITMLAKAIGEKEDGDA